MVNWLFNDFPWLSRRQQRLPSGNKSQQHTDHQQGGTKHNRDHQKLYQGGQAPHSSGRTGHHGYSQNRRWHHNQKHSPNDKEAHRNAKETENLKIEDSSVCTVPAEAPRGPEAVEKQPQQSIPEPETKRKDSAHERVGDRPKINLLQSSKDRLRRRLKEKVLFLGETLSFSFLRVWPLATLRTKGGLKGPFHQYSQFSLIPRCQHLFWGVFVLLQEAFYWQDWGSELDFLVEVATSLSSPSTGNSPLFHGGRLVHTWAPSLKRSVILQKKNTQERQFVSLQLQS